MEVITGSAAKAADRYAIDVMGIPSLELMQNASACVAEYIRTSCKDKKIVICAGTGNNGADGICIANILMGEFDIDVVITGDLKKASWEFYYQLSAYKRAGGKVMYLSDIRRLPEADVLVDAIYGIGLKGALRPDASLILAKVKAMNYPHIIAVDVPSGINSDTGEATGVVISANVTVTFGRNKTGLITGDGILCSGKVIVCDIGIPEEAYVRAGGNT